MTPEAQRIAIAEACGWKQSPYNNPDNTGFLWGYRNQEQRDSGRSEPIPDYLNDLNAMHEAEKYAGEHLMDADQWEEYGHALERIHPHACLKTPNEEKVDYYDFATLMVELTAAQRAEAFLRTLGLWKDEA